MIEPASLLEEIRFGYGPRLGWPLAADGVDPDRVMAQLGAADPEASVWTAPGMAERFAALTEAKRLRSGGAPGAPALDLRAVTRRDLVGFVARPASARLGFVERLVNLWANRLTVSSVGGPVLFILPYRDDAIRPNISGRYVDMLRAAVWHRTMLAYLNQTSSIGPNSVLGRRKGRGLNENLAREFLELHSMGSGFSQRDVTELARLMAG